MALAVASDLAMHRLSAAESSVLTMKLMNNKSCYGAAKTNVGDLLKMCGMNQSIPIISSRGQ